VTPRRALITRARGGITAGFFLPPRLSPTSAQALVAQSRRHRRDLPQAIPWTSPSRQIRPRFTPLPSPRELIQSHRELGLSGELLEPCPQSARCFVPKDSIRFLTPISIVSFLQHLVEKFCVLRRIPIAFLNSEHVSSPDRKPFALVPYLFLRSIRFSHL